MTINVADDVLIAEIEQLLPEVGRCMHSIMTHCPGAEGLSAPQMKALAYIFHHERRTIGELAQGLGVSMPAASELVDRLVEIGRLERGSNPNDRRQVLVWLTPEARVFAERMHALRRAQLQAVFDRLEPAERPVFARSMRTFVEVLRLQAHELPCASGEAARVTPGANG